MDNLQQLYKEYARLDTKTKEWTEKRDAVRAQLLEEMQMHDIKTDITPYGTFTVTNRTTYTYTPAIKALEEKVKIKKLDEVEQGLAKKSVSSFITYKA